MFSGKVATARAVAQNFSDQRGGAMAQWPPPLYTPLSLSAICTRARMNLKVPDAVPANSVIWTVAYWQTH